MSRLRAGGGQTLKALLVLALTAVLAASGADARGPGGSRQTAVSAVSGDGRGQYGSRQTAVSAGSGDARGQCGSRQRGHGDLSPAFQGRAEPIDAATRRRMTGVSWHLGCPIGFAGLRLLTVSHWGFDGRVHSGRLVVNRGYTAGMLRVMRTLYKLRYPIRQMRLVDAYGADDHRSMDADNTSAFNCRFVAGSPGVWSEHAYGRAIDVNPIENPYVTDSGYVSPPAGAPFARRSRHAKGMIHRGGPVVAAFAAAGWKWGGNWPWPKDYQHFSATGN